MLRAVIRARDVRRTRLFAANLHRSSSGYKSKLDSDVLNVLIMVFIFGMMVVL